MNGNTKQKMIDLQKIPNNISSDYPLLWNEITNNNHQIIAFVMGPIDLVSRDIAIIRNLGQIIQIGVRGVAYGEIDYTDKNALQNFIKLCEDLNLNWVPYYD